MGDNGSDNNEASINFCAKHPEPKAEDIWCVFEVVKANANGKGVFPNFLRYPKMMQPALRKGKISEETNLGVEVGGSVQKNRTYIVLDKKNSGRALLGKW
jgi:hypothetical protein